MPERRSQVERSASTQALLIAAAVASLVEKGWAATTAVEVCRRTGLTRGALVHHYPNLSGLLAAALQSVYDAMVAEIEREPASVADAIEITWTCVSDPRFKAVIEAWLAAANDDELRRELGPVIARFSKLVDPAGVPNEAFYLTAREALLGLALGRALARDASLPHEDVVLTRLRAQARELES